MPGGSLITRLYDFVDGMIVYEYHLDEEFDRIHQWLNGKLGDANLAPDADIQGTKLKVGTIPLDRLAETVVNKTYTDNAVAGVQTQVTTHTETLSTHATSIAAKADKTYVDGLDTALNTRVSSVEADIAGVNSAITTLQNITVDKVDKTYVDDQDANLQSNLNSLTPRVTDLETTVNGNGAEIPGLVSRVTSAESDVATLETSVASKASKTYVDDQIALVQAGQIGDYTIGTDKIIDLAITTAKLADDSVTSTKVDGVTVYTALQVDSAISTAQTALQTSIDNLTAVDVGASPADHTHTAADVGASPVGHDHDLVYSKLGHGHTAADVGAAPAGHNHDTAYATKTHGHAAADITYAGGADVSATNVEAALDELSTEKASKTVANTWTQRQTFGGAITDGDSNTDVSLIKSLQHQTHTRSKVMTYDPTTGRLTKYEEKNGATVVLTQTLNYDDANGGRLKNVVETAGGVTVTETMVYDANGVLTGTTRA